MKKVKTEITTNWLTEKPYGLEITVEYDNGFILQALKAIKGNSLIFKLSIDYSSLSFYKDEINSIHQILEDARVISEMKLKYHPKTSGTLDKWAKDICKMVEEKLKTTQA